MEPDENIRWYGIDVWPRPNFEINPVTYQKVYAAFHLIEDIDRNLVRTGDDTKSRGVFYAQIAKWLRVFDPGAGAIFHRMATAMTRNPDSVKDTRHPTFQYKFDKAEA